MHNNKRTGTQTQLQCIAYLHGIGCDISEPIGDNSRYDFILDIDGELFKVQSKTATPSRNGSWGIQCRSVYTNTRGTRIVRYERGTVDLFCTFIFGDCYIIPYEELDGKTHFTIRINKTKNCQKKKINDAEKYVAINFINSVKKAHGSLAQLVSAAGS